MSIVRYKVAPAIYHFSVPAESSGMIDDEARASLGVWGWVLATELLEAINEIREGKGHERLTAEQVGVAYPPFLSEDKPVIIYDHTNEEVIDGASLSNWFADAVSGGWYLPSGIGTRFLTLAVLLTSKK